MEMRRRTAQTTPKVELTPDERADHCIAWINSYCKLLGDRGQGVISFKLFSYQEDFIRSFWLYRENIILKARQLGMTETVAAIAVYCAITFPAWTIIILSKDQDAANEVLSKCRIAYDYLPDDVKVPVINPNITSTLKLTNRSRIIPKPTSPGAGRSFNAQVLILDEMAHMMWSDIVYTAASPAARSGGNKIVALSTANGAGNFFARQWDLAINGEGMHPTFLPWNVRPERDQAWYEGATRGYSSWQIAQELPTTPEEAFILSGRPRFDIAALDTILAQCTDPIRTMWNGELEIWIEPTELGRYVIGADTAEGLLKGDYSAAVVMDYHTGLDVATLHNHATPQEFATQLATLGAFYNNAYLAVERNTPGPAVLLALMSIQEYPNLYAHMDYDATGVTERYGYPTNSKTKAILIDALGETFTQLRPWRNRAIVREARTYIRNENGSTEASGNNHDDIVMAAAISEQARLFAPPQQEVVSLASDLGLAGYSIDDRYGADGMGDLYGNNPYAGNADGLGWTSDSRY